MFDFKTRKECNALWEMSVVRCTNCNRLGTFDLFPIDRRARRGVRGICKWCSSAKCSEWHRNNAESVASRNRRRREESRAEINRRERELREKNRDHVRALERERYWRNPDKHRKKCRAYHEENKEKISERCRSYNRDNSDYVRALWREKKRRQARCPKFRLNDRLRSLLRHSLKSGKMGKTTKEIVDYSIDELKAHLERQFLPGMGWHNMGDWHIDHIVPLAEFGKMNPDDGLLRVAWGLPNLRPIWAKENQRKGDRRLFLV